MLKKVIGIISYLPDNEEKRVVRIEKLSNLISMCDYLFNLPIIIIAQNGKDDIINSSNLLITRYDEPLGIVGARQELRKIFLNSEYDYLIMLDDDCELSGDIISAQKYLQQIDDHPNMFGTGNSTLLKLFAISKEVFSQLDFGNGRVEDGDYFEDILFVNTLIKKFPDKKFIFVKNNLNERSNNFNDPNSTGFYGQYNKHEIGDRTRAILGTM